MLQIKNRTQNSDELVNKTCKKSSESKNIQTDELLSWQTPELAARVFCNTVNSIVTLKNSKSKL